MKNIETHYSEQYEAKLGTLSGNQQTGLINPKADAESNQTPQTTTLQSTGANEVQQAIGTVGTIGAYLGYFFLTLLCLGLIIGIVKNTLRYIYSFYNTRRMSFIKVLLPKSDGKTDREQEKEIAKDMKEKI